MTRKNNIMSKYNLKENIINYLDIPVPQGVQEGAPALENVLIGQVSQTFGLLPTNTLILTHNKLYSFLPLLVVPAAQSTQKAPAASNLLPGGQVVHLDAPPTVVPVKVNWYS